MVDWKKRIATAVIGVPLLFYAASFKATAFVVAQCINLSLLFNLVNLYLSNSCRLHLAVRVCTYYEGST